MLFEGVDNWIDGYISSFIIFPKNGGDYVRGGRVGKHI